MRLDKIVDILMAEFSPKLRSNLVRDAFNHIYNISIEDVRLDDKLSLDSINTELIKQIKDTIRNRLSDENEPADSS